MVIQYIEYILVWRAPDMRQIRLKTLPSRERYSFETVLIGCACVSSVCVHCERAVSVRDGIGDGAFVSVSADQTAESRKRNH